MIARVKKALADGGNDVRIKVVPVERGARLHIETSDAILKCCRGPGT
jgi:hypothetical protein